MSLDSLSIAFLYPTFSMSIIIVDGTLMPLASVGFVITLYLFLSNVYHIPNLTMNLVFVGQLYDFDYLISFSSTSCFV